MIWMPLADTRPSAATPSEESASTSPTPSAEADAAVSQPPPWPRKATASASEEINSFFIALLPWSIALLFHAVLILIAAFVAWSTIHAADNRDVIIPVMRFSETPTAQLDTELEDRIEPTRTERQVQQRQEPPPQPQTQPSAFEQRIETATPLVGLEGAAEMSPFATTPDDDAFETRLFGVTGNARRLVFCIDASGSLIDTFPYVLHELANSIRHLSDQQQFTVLFFQGDQVFEPPPGGMQPATSAQKQRVIEWIAPDARNVVPHGRSNPVNAIRQAMQHRPDLIYLLSDNITGSGLYAISQPALLREIEAVNTANTKINTIQFVYPDALAQHGKGTMQLIAEHNDGTYRFISAEDLNLR